LSKVENLKMMVWGLQGSWWVQGKALVRGPEVHRKLLDLSGFGRLRIHFQTAQKHVVICK